MFAKARCCFGNVQSFFVQVVEKILLVHSKAKSKTKEKEKEQERPKDGKGSEELAAVAIEAETEEEVEEFLVKYKNL